MAQSEAHFVLNVALNEQKVLQFKFANICVNNSSIPLVIHEPIKGLILKLALPLEGKMIAFFNSLIC